MFLYKPFLLFILFGQSIFSCKQYQAIKEILDKYKRPITVLEISPNKGFFSFVIAKEYDSTCVMIENYNVDDIKALCETADSKNIILLKRELTPKRIERLSECEHFDVVIVNSLHIDFYEKEVEKLLKLGDYLFIKVENCKTELGDFLIKNQGKMVFQDVFCKIYCFKKNKKDLKRAYWHRSIFFTRKYFVESSFDSKFFIKKKKKYVWEKGINLTTFKALDGIYRRSLKKCRQ